MRTFEKTHSWLKFTLDLRTAPASLWILLGQCQARCEDIHSAKLPPDLASRLEKLYLAKGCQATTAIEGNTLTEQEVLAHLEGKLELPPSRQYLAREITNILAACHWIREIIPDLAAGKSALDPALVKRLNALALEGLILEENVAPGQVRRHEKLVFRYRPAPAEDCEFLLERLCDWINRKTFTPPPGMTIVYSLIKAVVTHLYLAWIHPFGDGNGRTARLIEHLVLLQAGVPAPAGHLLSLHYHLTRSEYFRQLDQASRSGGEVEPFLIYAFQGFRDGLSLLLHEIQAQQAEVLWQAHVHEIFRRRGGPGAERQLCLALDLAAASQPAPLLELPALSPRLAQTYAGKSAKTLSRDAQALVELGLAEKSDSGFRARREIVSAFPPAKP